jgi:hypothetical protein
MVKNSQQHPINDLINIGPGLTGIGLIGLVTGSLLGSASSGTSGSRSVSTVGSVSPRRSANPPPSFFTLYHNLSSICFCYKLKQTRVNQAI